MKNLFIIFFIFLVSNKVISQTITNQNVNISIDGDMLSFNFNKENSFKVIELIEVKTKKNILTEKVNNCMLKGKLLLKSGEYLFRVTTIFYNNKKYVQDKKITIL
jgi:hypothetical protein